MGFDGNIFLNYKHTLDKAIYAYRCIHYDLDGREWEIFDLTAEYQISHFTHEGDLYIDTMANATRKIARTIRDYIQLGYWASEVPEFYDTIKNMGLDFDMNTYKRITSGNRFHYFGESFGTYDEIAKDNWKGFLQDVLNEIEKERIIKIGKRKSRIPTELQCQNKLVKELKTEGYEVCKEYCITGCGEIDIVATKPGVTLIIEVKQNAHYDNIRKAVGQVIDYALCYSKRANLEKDYKLVKAIATPDAPKERLIFMLDMLGIRHILIDMES